MNDYEYRLKCRDERIKQLEGSLRRWQNIADERLDKIDNLSREIAYLLDVLKEKQANPSFCLLAPTGWMCVREALHEGPCAAIPLKNYADFS